jgi:hypothetical protein
VSGPAQVREVWTTEHNVALHCATPSRPYHRIVYRTKTGERKFKSGGAGPVTGRCDGSQHEQAWAKALEIDDELAASLRERDERTVRDLYKAWNAERRRSHADYTFEKDEEMWRRFVEPVAADWTLDELSRSSVKELLQKPDNESARRHLRASFGAMLTWAHAEEPAWLPEPREHYIPKPPRTGKSTGNREHGESHQFIRPELIPDEEQARALAESMRDVVTGDRSNPSAHRRRLGLEAWLLAALAASSGPRQGELFGTKVQKLRVSAGQFQIHKQVIRPQGGGYKLTPPKWGRTRTTMLPELTIWGEPLREPLAEYLDGMSPTDIAFPAARGGYHHPSNFDSRWFGLAAAQVSEWDERWTWQSLRHTFCSVLLTDKTENDEKGNLVIVRKALALADVAHLAGHRDTSVTSAMYVGPTRGVIERANAALAR